MLIPSIDLMGGKVVQLVQGSRKALEFADFEVWVDRFSKYPLVQLIDLDGAMESGSNHDLVRQIAGQINCQIGGGIRSVQTARAALELGARRVILGSALLSNAAINTDFAQRIAGELGPESLVFAVDARDGRVAIRGWKEVTSISPLAMIQALEPFCSAFLYTNIETEGMLQGIPMQTVRHLRQATSKQLIAAGGIRSQEEVDELHAIGVDAVVGMAIYRGLMPA